MLKYPTLSGSGRKDKEEDKKEENDNKNTCFIMM